MSSESPPAPAPQAPPEPAASDAAPADGRPVRQRLPRRYRRQPRRTARGTGWIGWLALVCAPAFLLLALDQIDLRRPASQDYADAEVMHRELIQLYQRDAYTRPEAEAVIARLERVPASSRDYAEAQDLLQRYRWEAERAAEAQAAVAEAVVVESAPRIWKPAPPGTAPDTTEGAPRAAPDEVEPTLPGVAEVEPTLPSDQPPASGWSTIAPSKPTTTPAPPPGGAARTTSDRELAARVGLRCYTATRGTPTAADGARFDVRLGGDPQVRIAGLRVRNLRDLREALHRLAGSDAALADLDAYLESFSEDALSAAALAPAPVSYWLWVDAPKAPVFVDLLAEAARCQGRNPTTSAANPSDFIGPPSAGDDAATLTLPIEGSAGQSLEVRLPARRADAAVELWLRVAGEPRPVARFALPGAANPR